MFLAFEKKFVPMIYLILETIKKQKNKEINVDEKNSEGDTAIILSLKMKNFGLFKTLLDMAEKNENLLFQVCEYSNLELLQYCFSQEFKNKYNIEYTFGIKDSNGASLLHYGAKNGDIKICQYLIESGIDINSKDNEGNIPLIYSLRENVDVSFIKFLINKGSTRLEDIYEESIKTGAYCIVSYLIKKGIDINRVNQKGESPLNLLTSYSQNVKIGQMLLKHGYYIKQELRNKQNDLFYRAIKRKDSNKEFIEFLIKNGANFEQTYD